MCLLPLLLPNFKPHVNKKEKERKYKKIETCGFKMPCGECILIAFEILINIFKNNYLTIVRYKVGSDKGKPSEKNTLR
jgi:hypothetical protein